MKELPFPREEYEQRIERARALMRSGDIDVLVAGTGTNLTYLSGYPSPAKSPSRPFFFVLPLHSDPCVIVHDGRRFEAERYAWVDEVRTYAALSHVPVAELADALRARGLANAVIGIEQGNEMIASYSVWELERLRERLPGIRLVDGSRVLWGLRMIKSPREIDLIRRACAATTRVYARCFPLLRAGMSEVEAERLVACAHFEEGASAPWTLIVSSPDDYDLASKPAGLRRFSPGDMVWFDLGCTIGGYHSDFSRSGVLGRVSDRRREAQAVVNAATSAGVRAVRPGRTVAEIARACDDVLDGSGLTLTDNISRTGGRIGHGLGLDGLELPSLNTSDATVVRPGMVLTIEPGVATIDGIFHHEQNVVVTDDGCEILSLAPTEIVEIAP